MNVEPVSEPMVSEPILELSAQDALSDYVTAIAWSPMGNTLAVASGDGEVRLFKDFAPISLCPPTGKSVDTIAFSMDGQWLAAGGQDGTVSLWQMDSAIPKMVNRIKTDSWVDRLVWSPTVNRLAFNQGKNVQIWDADDDEAVIILTGPSMPQDIRWSPDGNHLAIAAQNNVYIWNAQDWDAVCYQWELMSPASSIAWSADGVYLACAIQDHSLGILDWSSAKAFQEQPIEECDLPVLMQGFPGKVRRLAWSNFPDSADLPPILAAATREIVTMWLPTATDWESWALELHNANVLDVAFQPQSGLLASLSEDGWIIIWQAAVEASQVIEGPKKGFSCLAWHPQGEHLAAGGQNGDVLIWSMATA